MAVEHYLLGETPAGVPEVNLWAPPSRSYDEERVGIHSWRYGVRGPPPPASVCSEASVSTVRDYGEHDYQNGEWAQ